MIILKTLLSLAFVGFFFAPKPMRLDDLPLKCWEKIFSFDKTHFYEHCASACFKISVMKTACDELFVTHEMIKRCRLAGRKDRHGLHSFFSLFDEKEREGICSDFKKRIELIEQITDLGLFCKYRGTKPPEGSDDFKKMCLSDFYKEMHRSALKREGNYGLKQIELLRCYGISIPDPTDTESESGSGSGSESTSSTMSVIPEGSEYDLQSDSGSD